MLRKPVAKCTKIYKSQEEEEEGLPLVPFLLKDTQEISSLSLPTCGPKVSSVRVAQDSPKKRFAAAASVPESEWVTVDVVKRRLVKPAWDGRGVGLGRSTERFSIFGVVKWDGPNGHRKVLLEGFKPFRA